MSILKLKVTLEVSADIDERGRVQHAWSVGARAVGAAIEAQHEPETLAAAVAQKTRSRIDDGLVRIVQSHAYESDTVCYVRYVRRTQTQVVVTRPGLSRDERYWRSDGRAVGSRPGLLHGAARIHPDDLAAINAGVLS